MRQGVIIMRFYHQLVQNNLTKHFRNVINASILNDTKYPLRNNKLSKAKQELGGSAITEIKELKIEKLAQQFNLEKTTETLDDFIQLEFIKIVGKYEKKIQDTIKKAEVTNLGSSEDAVSEASKIIEKTKSICQELQIYNRNYEKSNPLKVFQMQVSDYLCSKINIKKNEILTKEKMAMVKVILDDSINGFERAKGFPIEQLKHIRTYVEKAIVDNQKLCKSKKTGIPLPFSNPLGNPLSAISVGLNFFNIKVSLTPDEGYLKDCLDIAMSKLNKIEKTIVKQAQDGLEKQGLSFGEQPQSQFAQQSAMFSAPAQPTKKPQSAAQLRYQEILAELDKPIAGSMPS